MKNLLFASVSSIALLAMPALAIAECNIGEQSTYAKEDQGVKSGPVRRDLRDLRDAAFALKDYGRDEACQVVVKAINDIRSDPDAEKKWASGYAKRTGDQSVVQRYERDSKMTWQERTESRMAKATPVSEVAGSIQASTLIGADIVGLNNDTIGEVNDLILGSDAKPAYILLVSGGFLGLGEEQTAVPFDKLTVNYDEDGEATYFLPMTEDQLSKAPRFKRGDTNWLKDENWKKTNAAYYDEHVKTK